MVNCFKDSKRLKASFHNDDGVTHVYLKVHGFVTGNAYVLMFKIYGVDLMDIVIVLFMCEFIFVTIVVSLL